MYFKADLQGLINELSKYSSLDEALDLVQTVDYINVDYINYIILNHSLGVSPVKKVLLWLKELLVILLILKIKWKINLVKNK